MKLSGEATLSAPVEEVYRALHDPEVLVRTIPGCRRLERVGEDSYLMTVDAGVAAIKGTFGGSVSLTSSDPPHEFVLWAKGSGSPGTVRTEVRVSLSGTGGATLLRYDADADVGGPIGGVGQRLLASVAQRTAQEFFTAVNGVLAEVPVPPTVEPEVFARPPRARVAAPGGFLAGAAVGAGAALLGALVGGWVVARALRGRR